MTVCHVLANKCTENSASSLDVTINITITGRNSLSFRLIPQGSEELNKQADVFPAPLTTVTDVPLCITIDTHTKHPQHWYRTARTARALHLWLLLRLRKANSLDYLVTTCRLCFSTADRLQAEDHAICPFHENQGRKSSIGIDCGRTECLSERFSRGRLVVCRWHGAGVNDAASCGQGRGCRQFRCSAGVKRVTLLCQTAENSSVKT